MYHIATNEPQYPPLDRAAFLIERACVPQYVPRYCAETAQLFAAMADALNRTQQPGGEKPDE